MFFFRPRHMIEPFIKDLILKGFIQKPSFLSTRKISGLFFPIFSKAFLFIAYHPWDDCILYQHVVAIYGFHVGK